MTRVEPSDCPRPIERAETDPDEEDEEYEIDDGQDD